MSGYPVNFNVFYDISRKAGSYNTTVLTLFQGVMWICQRHYSDPFFPHPQKKVGTRIC